MSTALCVEPRRMLRSFEAFSSKCSSLTDWLLSSSMISSHHHTVPRTTMLVVSSPLPRTATLNGPVCPASEAGLCVRTWPPDGTRNRSGPREQHRPLLQETKAEHRT